MEESKRQSIQSALQQEYQSLIKGILQQNIGEIQRVIWKHPKFLYQFTSHKNPLTVACEHNKIQSIRFIINKIVKFYDKKHLKIGNFIDDSLIYCIQNGNLHLIINFGLAGYSLRRVVIEQNGCQVNTLDLAILFGQQKIAQHLCLHYYGESWKKKQESQYQYLIKNLRNKYIIHKDDYRRVRLALFQLFGYQTKQRPLDRLRKVCQRLNQLKRSIISLKEKKNKQISQYCIQTNRKLKK